MLVLFETPAGHALFTLASNLQPSSVSDLEQTITKVAKLKAFQAFSSTTSALSSVARLIESKPTKDLRKFLEAQLPDGESLLVADPKLASNLKEKTGLKCIYNKDVGDIMRAIRMNLEDLLETNTAVQNVGTKEMVLGLAHSLSRYKLKFSPDKVDTMIVQAISLLDDLDKEINVYSMRLREWYGWHFPEMGKIVTENASYAKVINKMGMRTSATECDFSDCVPEHVEEELKAAANISMGTEISDDDLFNIRSLCQQVISLLDYRSTLFEYLKSRMTAIAPNLTIMVGELVGARLIAHAGNLISLAKCPASTVQILGAEKALFRALKTKHATPKYGLIYHASVVGQAAPKHKGKISRSLAAKCALAIRVDALGKSGDVTVGEQGRLAIEARLSQLEGRQMLAVSKLAYSDKKQQKYRAGASAGKSFNHTDDFSKKEDKVIDTPSVQVEKVTAAKDVDMEDAEDGEVNGVESHEKENGSERKKKKKDKKDKKKKDKKRQREEENEEDAEKKKKKKKKKKKERSE